MPSAWSRQKVFRMNGMSRRPVLEQKPAAVSAPVKFNLSITPLGEPGPRHQEQKQFMRRPLAFTVPDVQSGNSLEYIRLIRNHLFYIAPAIIEMCFTVSKSY